MNNNYTKKITVKQLETGEETSFTASPAVFLRALKWQQDMPEGSYRNVMGDFAWLVLGAKEAGLLSKLGIAGDVSEEALLSVASLYTVEITDTKDKAPLAHQRSK